MTNCDEHEERWALLIHMPGGPHYSTGSWACREDAEKVAAGYQERGWETEVMPLVVG